MKRARFTYEEGGPLRSVEHFLAELKRFAGKGDFRLCFRGHGEPSGSLLPFIRKCFRDPG
jgi:hypothetical protein